uniref:hypothetical protein n=1 Tax=Nocardioides sp. TaxID=35761 RepID=UPI00356A17E9
ANTADSLVDNGKLATRVDNASGLDDARWRSLLDHLGDWRSLLDHLGDWRSLLDHLGDWRSLLDQLWDWRSLLAQPARRS